MNQPETQTPEEHFKRVRELRLLLDEYLSASEGDPIMEALLERETDVVRVTLLWSKLYELVQATFEGALKKGASLEVATQKADETKAQIAARILSEKGAR